MSSSIGRIYDDYDDYTCICNKLGIEVWEIRDPRGSFYNHLDSILKDNGVDNIYDFHRKLKEKE